MHNMEEEKGIFPTTGYEPEARGKEGLGRIVIPHKDMEKHLAIFLASFHEGEKGFYKALGGSYWLKLSGNWSQRGHPACPGSQRSQVTELQPDPE